MSHDYWMPPFGDDRAMDRWLKVTAPDEWAELQAMLAEQREAKAAAMYLDPYNEAVGIFLEYEMGYAGLPNPLTGCNV